MKNTFGQSVSVTVFGESHGEAVGAVIDGLAPGIAVKAEYIERQLSRRRPSLKIDTARIERDAYSIVSGVFNGKTTGTPICIIIPNENTESGDYDYGKARPSHADYAAYCKYHGFEDYRGGGHFSGRITAALVAAGAVLSCALDGLGISVGTHILNCCGVSDREFADFRSDIQALKNSGFPVLDATCAEKMTERIEKVAACGDSAGGKIQTAVSGLPSGLGEPWFDSVESNIAHAIFSIGGIKGIEFGTGFGCSEMTGSEFNDPFRVLDGKIITETNNNGGINGGITNGMPVVFNCAVKPTPSIYKKQKTVDFINRANTELQIRGRHDPAIIRRICPVVDGVTAVVLCDMLAQRYGTDVFLKGID